MFTMDFDPREILLATVKQFWPAKGSRARVLAIDSDGKKMYKAEILTKFSEQKSTKLYVQELGPWEEGTIDDEKGKRRAKEMIDEIHRKLSGKDESHMGSEKHRLYRAFMVGRLNNDFIVNYDPESNKYVTNLDVEIQFEMAPDEEEE